MKMKVQKFIYFAYQTYPTRLKRGLSILDLKTNHIY